MSAAAQNRHELIKKIQAARDGRLCIAYITSTRPGHEIQMADDVLRRIFDHLELHRKEAAHGVDLFIHSNGGSGTAPWRIVNLIREYTSRFAVLVPHHAFSAATLLSLGADQIVMHRMGCLGPIDPSVTNAFNPQNPSNPSQLVPISVEDVTAYFKLVKDEVGINHEDELIESLNALTGKIHPLALGNVQRSHNQSRLMARKLLKKHMSEDRDHEISTIIDSLKSNLFFHGHPINRDEAARDLKLKVEKPSAELEECMWALFAEYESAMNLKEPFNPLHEIEKRISSPAPTAPLTAQDVVQQMAQLAPMGIGIGGGLSEEQIVKIAAAMASVLRAGKPETKFKIDGMVGALVESIGRTDTFKTDLTIYRAMLTTPSGPQEVVKQEVTRQRWEVES